MSLQDIIIKQECDINANKCNCKSLDEKQLSINLQRGAISGNNRFDKALKGCVK